MRCVPIGHRLGQGQPPAGLVDTPMSKRGRSDPGSDWRPPGRLRHIGGFVAFRSRNTLHFTPVMRSERIRCWPGSSCETRRLIPRQCVARLVTDAITPCVFLADTLGEMPAKLPPGPGRSEHQPAGPGIVVEVWFPSAGQGMGTSAIAQSGRAPVVCSRSGGGVRCRRPARSRQSLDGSDQ